MNDAAPTFEQPPPPAMDAGGHDLAGEGSPDGAASPPTRDAPQAGGLSPDQAKRLRKKVAGGAQLTGEEREKLDAYARTHKRGRPPGKPNAPKPETPAAPPKPVTSADFRGNALGAPGPDAPQAGSAGAAAPATPVQSKCGDPDCVWCVRQVRKCPITGREIRPKIPIEAAATYAGGLLGGIAIAIGVAFKENVTEPSGAEILRLAPHMQELVWRRFGEAEEYSDIAAVVGCAAAFGFSRAAEAIEERKKKKAHEAEGAPVADEKKDAPEVVS